MLLLRIDTLALQVRLNAGGDAHFRRAGVGATWEIPRTYFRPDAWGRAYQRPAKLLRHLPDSDILRRIADPTMVMGGAFLGGTVSILHMQDAALLRDEKSLLLASVRGSLDLPFAAKQMCRLRGPFGGFARQDVLAAEDIAAKSDEGDLSYQAWAAWLFGKPRKREEARRGIWAIIAKWANRGKGGRQVRYCFDGGYPCDGEHHLAPECQQRKK